MRRLLPWLLTLATLAPVCALDLSPFRDPIFQSQALAVARAALNAWVLGQPVRLPGHLTPTLSQQAGVFVSLENRHLRVRGCRGTLYPRTSRLVDEIVSNVREACQLDPLHPRVKATELANIRIVLCVPGDAQTVDATDIWDAHLYGVLVESGDRAAVMLPWEAPDSEHQILWGRKRAGIGPGEVAHLERFPAVRFAETFPSISHPRPQPTSTLPYW